MTQPAIVQRGQVARKIEEIGSCMELVPMDPNFNNVSVGLYIKEGVLTVWSFSRADGVNDRLRDIRDQMARLGDLAPVEDTDNQLIFPCGMVHERPVKFLLTQAVTKSPDFTHPEGPMTIKDSKSALMLTTTGVSRRLRVRLQRLRRRRGQKRDPASAHGGRGLRPLRRNGQGRRHRSRLHLPPAPRRLGPAASPLLPQHQRRRIHARSRSHPRPDDHQHPRLLPPLAEVRGVGCATHAWTMRSIIGDVFDYESELTDWLSTNLNRRLG